MRKIPKWIVEVAVIYMVLALALSQAHASEVCDALAMRAYDCQFDRQHGSKCQWEPTTRLERVMSVAVWGQPQFFADERKQRRAAEFAREWKTACLKGEYQ